MKIKKLIIIFEFLFFITFVTASLNISESNLGYYKFNNNPENSGVNETLDFIDGNNPIYVDSFSNILYKQIKYNKSYSQYSEITNYNGISTQIRSLSFWFNTTTSAGNSWLFGISDGTSNNRFHMIYENNDFDIGLNVGGASAFYESNCFHAQTNKKYYVVINLGSGGFEVFVDGSLISNCSDVSEQTLTNSFNIFQIGKRYSNDNYFTGCFDNLYVSSERFTSVNITQGYNDGYGYDYTNTTIYGDIYPPDMTILYPANNSIIETDIFINVSINESGICNLNNTLWVLHYSNSTYYSFLETTANESNYNINVSCADVSGNEISEILNFTKKLNKVTIEYPPNDFSLKANDINITFTFNNFNANNCTLITNLTGKFTPINNKTGGMAQNTNYTINITPTTEIYTDINYAINCKSDIVNLNSSFNLIHFNNDYTIPFITIIYPNQDNLSWNTDINITVSTNELTSCVINNSFFTNVFDNSTYFIYTSTSLNNSFYTIKLNCSDLANNYNIQLINFTIDKEYPLIIFNNPNENNNSVFTALETFFLKINMTDNNGLYRLDYNISYYDTDYETIMLLYKNNISLSGTNYYYINPINPLNFTNNTDLFVTGRLCDMHSITKLKKLKTPDIIGEWITFNNGNSYIKIRCVNCSDIKVKEKQDRFSFEFKYDKDIPIKEYIIKSNEHIDFLQDSKYTGHLIIYEKILPVFWYDSENDKNDVTTKYINGEYHVYLETDDKKIKFNSIGELNCVTKTVTFVLDSTETTTLTGIEFSVFNSLILFFIFLLIQFGIIWVGFKSNNGWFFVLASAYGIVISLAFIINVSAIPLYKTGLVIKIFIDILLLVLSFGKWG